jgi:hypothetical protein
MKLRYAGVCRVCGTELAAKVEAIYERSTKTVRCLVCSSDPLVEEGARVEPLVEEGAPRPSRNQVVCPRSRGVEIRWISCHGDDAVPLELYRGEPSELAVTTLPVVPDLEVLEDRVG